jgi:hypothetical protein
MLPRKESILTGFGIINFLILSSRWKQQILPAIFFCLLFSPCEYFMHYKLFHLKPSHDNIIEDKLQHHNGKNIFWNLKFLLSEWELRTQDFTDVASQTKVDGGDVSVLMLRGSYLFILVTQHCYNEEIAGGCVGTDMCLGQGELGRPKMRWEDNIEIYYMEKRCEGGKWMKLPRDCVQWQWQEEVVAVGSGGDFNEEHGFTMSATEVQDSTSFAFHCPVLGNTWPCYSASHGLCLTTRREQLLQHAWFSLPPYVTVKTSVYVVAVTLGGAEFLLRSNSLLSIYLFIYLSNSYFRLVSFFLLYFSFFVLTFSLFVLSSSVFPSFLSSYSSFLHFIFLLL